MKLRALRALKREAKSAFIFVLERGVPLHRALASPSNPAGSGRRQRVAVVCRRKQIRRAAHRPPPMLDRGEGLVVQKIVLPKCSWTSVFPPSICPNVFGLNCLIGMSSADDDTSTACINCVRLPPAEAQGRGNSKNVGIASALRSDAGANKNTSG